MGLFDELDIAGAADDPFNIPDNTYAAVVYKVESKKNSKGNMGLTITYKIMGGEQNGLQVTDYLRMPSKTDETPLEGAERERALSYIKRRLNDLGVPEVRMNTVEPADLVGTECYITTKKNGDYTNVREVNLTLNEVPGSVGEVATNPFA